MTDIRVGVTLPQFTDDASKFLDGARRAEEAGLDSIWVFDHMWPLSGGRERPVIECWTALGTVAVVTERVGIGSLVTRSSLRHPALIGKMAATVGDVAPGRLTVAIGSGDTASRDENEAFGLPYFDGRMRYVDLASTVEVVRRYLNEDRFSHADEIVTIQDLPTSPGLAHPPPIWVAGRSKPILEIAGRLADGWNGWGGTPEKFADDAARVRTAADGRGVELTWGGLVLLERDDDTATSKLGTRDPAEWVVGGPETVARRLQAFIDVGATHLVCTFPDPGRPGVYELLAESVLPRLGLR